MFTARANYYPSGMKFWADPDLDWTQWMVVLPGVGAPDWLPMVLCTTNDSYEGGHRHDHHGTGCWLP
jgi:hypothetical protein